MRSLVSLCRVERPEVTELQLGSRAARLIRGKNENCNEESETVDKYINPKNISLLAPTGLAFINLQTIESATVEDPLKQPHSTMQIFFLLIFNISLIKKI